MKKIQRHAKIKKEVTKVLKTGQNIESRVTNIVKEQEEARVKL